MILIPAGDFFMGEGKSLWHKILPSFLQSKKNTGENIPENVRPKRKIYLNDFYIDKYPVTNLNYKNFVERTGYKASASGEGFCRR